MVCFLGVECLQLHPWMFISVFYHDYQIPGKYDTHTYIHLYIYIIIVMICMYMYLQGRRKKKLFWLSTIAPLVSVILSTLIVYLTRADKHGVKIVKHVKSGLNPSSIHQLQFNGAHTAEVVKIGLVVSVIALTVHTYIHTYISLYQLDIQKVFFIVLDYKVFQYIGRH